MTAGQYIAKVINEKGVGLTVAAQLLEISEKYLADLISGKLPVSAYVAVRLEREFGMSAQFILVRQVTMGLTKARYELEGIPLGKH